MCGIGGIVSINNSVIDQKISDDIKNSLNHRGPDHSLIKNINPNCTFVHSRLAIIDLNPRSNQPLSSDDDKYHIVFNGEIYNYKELRSELKSLGYEFKSEGDTEVLLVGYQHFGKEILNKLIGQFAFVIADYNKNYYFMARDRIGLKPLYYSIGNQYFAFSSEFNALNTSNLVSFSPNREAYVSYLRHLAIPSSSTGNENIQKVKPGEFIVVDFEGKIKKELYWDPFDFTTEQDITSSEAIDCLDNLLKSSVEYRKISDVEVGLYLSGGLDSTLIGSLLATDTKIKSFNVDYDEIFDGYKGEFKEAQYSADQINVELIHKSISFEEFRSIISDYSFLQDDLIGDEVGIPLYFLGKLAKTNGLKVVQVGEGADELFYGYDHWLRFAKLYKSIPKFNSISSQNNFKSHRANLLFNIIQNNNPFPGGAVGFNLAQIKKLVKFDYTTNSNLINYSDNLWEDYYSREDFSITKWMTLIDLKIRLPELLLMRMDKLSMQSGVEARVPFLDHRIVEFVLSLPENIIFDINRTKPLLKKLSKRHIPEKVLSRRKQGFRAPISNWIQKDPDYFFDKIHEFNLNYNFFEPTALSRTLKSGDIQKIWYIYNLSSWHLSRITK
jgi:asparagine synthase (glutamine-hydrolysing)